jgi:predicted DNA-binding transcriptional regulator AlpA
VPNEEGIPRVWSARETFRHFGYSENAGYRAVREGSFPVRAIHVGPRKIVFSEAAIRRVLEGGAE